MTSFASLALDHRLGNHSKLSKLSKIINWDKFSKYLSKLHKSDINPSNGGNSSYDKIAMFKLILLGQWNNLSDPELEYALRVRLDFISFCGFDIDGNIPDHSTICRFRNKLIDAGLMKKLFDEVNEQLVLLNLKVEKTNLAVLDATIVESSCRSRGNVIEEEIANDRDEDEFDVNSQDQNQDNNNFQETSLSADKDAAWLKKGGKSHFGYKSFAITDEEGFITATHTTPANKSETSQFNEITKNLNDKNAKRLGADKAYDSQNNRSSLKRNGIKTGIMHRKPRGKAMSKWQKRFNYAISQKRFRVEQTFGTLKRKFKFNRASYKTTIKVNAQFTLKAICLNLLKAVNKITVLISPQQLKAG